MTGGLVTTCAVVRADFWRLGQCRPGDTIRFKRISWESALLLRQRTEAFLQAVKSGGSVKLVDINLPAEWEETVLDRIPATSSTDEVAFRQAGDSYLHVTYGTMTSSALTRARIQHRVDRIKEMSDIVAITAATRCEYRIHRETTSDKQHITFNSIL
jgi:urea carboxylase